MSNTVFAVLIEVVSIQKYVFSSNKLKENLGASWLMQEIFTVFLDSVAGEIMGRSDLNAWEKEHSVIQMNNGAEFEVGYIGGGNALLFFRQEAKAREFINEWTKRLLVVSPGIVTALALGDFDLDEDFPGEIKKIFAQLHQNKYSQIPQTLIARHGITAECAHSGYSMENNWLYADNTYLSSSSWAKIEASERAGKELAKQCAGILNNQFCFSDELDQLGQLTGESHIAIVHIDGNGMGKRFRKAASLEQLRKLSCAVQNVTTESFMSLLKHIADNFSDIETALGYEGRHKWPEERGKKILPFRPIIIGGDELTFVSEGRLGIYFAKLFLQFFEAKGAEIKVEKGNGLSACAGAAITKTKYPFYRGYQLSAELCGSAKKTRLREKDHGSWLDFHVAYGGFSGTIDEIRESHYQSPGGSLLFRPYKINSTDEKGFETLVKNTQELKNSLPKNKRKELRQVLTLGKASIEKYMSQNKARRLKLPEIKGNNYHIRIYENNETPYFDMIEFMEFYPSFEL